MKIEIMESFKDKKENFVAGEIRVVSQEDGEYFCSTFGAVDTEGKVATAKLKPGVKKLDIRGIKRTQTAEVIGG